MIEPRKFVESGPEGRFGCRQFSFISAIQPFGTGAAEVVDPRWLEFGLNLPAAPNVPVIPRNVAVNTNTTGEFFITCAPSRYATHYRFFTARPGVDEEPVHVGNSDEPMFHLTGLTTGETLEIYVTAANSGAESLFSKPVSATVAGEEEAAA
jgi:hypothetical protein